MLFRFRTALALMALIGLMFSTGHVAAQSAPQAAAPQTAAPPPNAAKVSQLLLASGYTFKQDAPTVWSINRTGASYKSFRLFIAIAGDSDLMVMGVIVAKKAQMQMKPEFMLALLRFDHTLDRVKVGIDDDGDLFVRTDSSCRILDVDELKALVEQVSAAANEVYAGSTSYITPN